MESLPFAPRPNPPISPGEAPYLAHLNDMQRLAVETLDGPVLVLAGAGTGKTRVLTTRLVHLLSTRRVYPSQILSVTFTNKAAREMKDRVSQLLGMPVEGWWLGTFHALAARLLRRHAELVGLKSNFTILDTDDQIRLIKQQLEALRIDDKKWPARVVLGVIERWKDRALTPDKLKAGDGGDVAGGRVVELYSQYQARLRALNACDFGDLLLHNISIFQQHPDVLAEQHRRFKYLLVDEYQDTNVAQYLWLRLLAQGSNNVCCVGDDDQCVATGTRITMADGSEKPVEQVVSGDLVLSSYGSGDFRAAKVLRTARRSVRRPLIRIATQGGRSLLTTPEHSHFADVVLHDSPQRYFTYLMLKHGVGYRLGTSQIYTRGQKRPMVGYVQRCLQEHGDAVWLIRAFAKEADARDLEHRLSLEYGITTFPFVARKGSSTNGLVHDQERLDRLHRDLSVTSRVTELMQEYRLDSAHPHHVPQGEPGRRRNLTLTLNAEHRGPTPMHRIALSGNDEAGRAALVDLALAPRPYKRNPQNWRYETLFRDFERIEEIRSRLATRFDLTVVRKANILGKALTIRPASQLVQGMVVPAADGTHDVVTDVGEVEYAGDVVDLDIEGTHNFIANGIVTHNSIYGWRGAEVGNILRFETDFPGAKVIRLEQNYRSTSHILAAASGVIAHNQGRLGKTLWTDAPEGEKVRVFSAWDGEEEARLVGDEIETLQRAGRSLKDMAVLVRAGWQMREFEERFLQLGLPYRVIGGPRFYERMEIRDALAYFRVIVQPDDDLAFERIINTPKRGIGDATIQILHAYARSNGIPLTESALRLVDTDELKPKLRATLRGLMGDFGRWRDQVGRIRHTELARIVLDESGYTAMWQADKSPEAEGRLENLKELVDALDEFETLEGFLEHVSLVMDVADSSDGDMATLMTLHGAKGLEFPVVFLPGWEEGLFPSQRAMDETGIAGLEEERRLAYVGITRARERAYVSHAANRRMFGSWAAAIPSRFVEELPEVDIERMHDATAHTHQDRFTSGFEAWTHNHGMTRAVKSPPRPMGERPVVLDGRAFVTERKRPETSYRNGERIFHQKFGYGTIVWVDNDKLEIDFDAAGRKKVMDSFVVPADKAS